jgi:hypothetical protein
LSGIYTKPLSIPPAALNYLVESADTASEYTIGFAQRKRSSWFAAIAMLRSGCFASVIDSILLPFLPPMSKNKTSQMKV